MADLLEHALRSCPFLEHLVSTQGEEYGRRFAARPDLPASGPRPLFPESTDDVLASFKLFHACPGGVVPLQRSASGGCPFQHLLAAGIDSAAAGLRHESAVEHTGTRACAKSAVAGLQRSIPQAPYASLSLSLFNFLVRYQIQRRQYCTDCHLLNTIILSVSRGMGIYSRAAGPSGGYDGGQSASRRAGAVMEVGQRNPVGRQATSLAFVQSRFSFLPILGSFHILSHLAL